MLFNNRYYSISVTIMWEVVLLTYPTLGRLLPDANEAWLWLARALVSCPRAFTIPAYGLGGAVGAELRVPSVCSRLERSRADASAKIRCMSEASRVKLKCCPEGGMITSGPLFIPD